MAQKRNRMQNFREDGYAELRIWHRKEQKRGRGTLLPRYLIKCGCCRESLEIFYNKSALEINGVSGSIENWREILLPLLEQK